MINIVDICQKISQPISVEAPVGVNLSEETTYEFIEEQMMKVGSLSHGSVQWKKVEQSILDLLSTKTKDLKLLIYLFQCFHHQNTTNSLTASIAILSGFMTNYWESCYPYAGKKGTLARKKFFNQIIQRFDISLDKTDLLKASSEDLDKLNDAVSDLDNSLDKLDLHSDDSSTLVVKIKRKAKEFKARAKLNKNTKDDEVNSNEKTINSEAIKNIEFDNSSDKSTKQTCLKMAEYFEEQGNNFNLAIGLRRYALWSSITSLPDNIKNKTLVSPPPSERIKEYWDLLDTADLTLWKRVEKTLSMTPYWFDGQYLSYQIAMKLGYTSSAQVILFETQKFLKRLPEIYKFQFKDESYFISSKCKDWLDGEGETNSGRRKSKQTSSTGSWESRKNTIIELAKNEGLEASLLKLNTEISKANEPRENTYWRLISVELLINYGLKNLANQQLQQLLQEVESSSVSEWEPSLLKRIKKHLPAK